LNRDGSANWLIVSGACRLLMMSSWPASIAAFIALGSV